jgi:solute carrier family 25 (mitochondrial carnitine/acylcarnitine transporter), member 20/29
MSVDFWAGYFSGVVGLLVGNPLDIIKVRLQASGTATTTGNTFRTLTTGTAAPILGYGALNAILFVTYNRSEAALNRTLSARHSLLSTWLAGAVGGLAIWVISTPTELIKCRAQVSQKSHSSSAIARQIYAREGLRGFYFGGIVTALRDSIGYGFYFWAYELAARSWPAPRKEHTSLLYHEAPKIFLCGGIAGVATWASVFPLDVIKTRVQTQQIQAWPPLSGVANHAAANSHQPTARKAAWKITTDMYRDHGLRPFFRGLTVCCIRAFIVNAAQWAVYEWSMRSWGP